MDTLHIIGEFFLNIWPAIGMIIELLIITFCFYVILRTLRHTPGIFAFFSLVTVVGGIAALAYYTKMPALAKVTNYIFSQLPLIIIVVFQQDIRRMLILLSTMLNSNTRRLFKRRRLDQKQRSGMAVVEELMHAVCSLSARAEWREYMTSGKTHILASNSHLRNRNTGALIAIQGQQGLDDHIEQGAIPLNCAVNSLLLQNIFYPGAPLHDGGVIIKGDRIIAASSTFPLAQNKSYAQTSGTRHQAALGLAERSDALVIVVSEETGYVSVAFPHQDGMAHLERMNTPQGLLKALQSRYLPADAADAPPRHNFLTSILRRLVTRRKPD